MALTDSTSYIEFTKMHGAGNDYIYINAIDMDISNPEELAYMISDRHFGVGGDGLVLILNSDKADFRMRMFNTDGSEAQMCGNASRCVAKYIYEHRLSAKRTLTLETLAGIKVLNLVINEEDRVESVTVDMGAPILEPAEIPVIPSESHPNGISLVEMDYDGNIFKAIAVSMGNPHAVIFVNNISDSLINCEGRAFECHQAWPQKTNVEFVKILSPTEIDMRVWERGSGETLACGTGSCAAVVAGILTGRLENQVQVNLLGGKLTIRYDADSGHVFMTGNAVTVAEGLYFIDSAPAIGSISTSTSASD